MRVGSRYKLAPEWIDLKDRSCQLCGSSRLEIRELIRAKVYLIRCECGMEIQHESRDRLLEAVGVVEEEV